MRETGKNYKLANLRKLTQQAKLANEEEWDAVDGCQDILKGGK